jgi:hypothetical protein
VGAVDSRAAKDAEGTVGATDLRKVEVAAQAAGVAVGAARGQVGKEGVLEGTLEAEGVEIPDTGLASTSRPP